MISLNKPYYKIINKIDCIVLNSFREISLNSISIELNIYSQKIMHNEINNTLYENLGPDLTHELYG